MFLIILSLAVVLVGLCTQQRNVRAFFILAGRNGVKVNIMPNRPSRASDDLFLELKVDDDKMIERLDSMKALSPAKKNAQRVGCVLLSDDVVIIGTTNTFKRNVGVHAEMNAVSQYLNIIPAPTGPLEMAITYSPCLECARLILLIPQIRCVTYELKYDCSGIKLLEQEGVEVRRLAPTSTQEKVGLIQKQHSYSKLSWAPNVTDILIIRASDDQVVLSHTATLPFDVRPFLIQALRNRSQSSESLRLSYSGNLNHRETLFLEVMDMNSTCYFE